VMAGGKLLLDAATLTNKCELKWKGIVLEKKQGKEGAIEVLSHSTMKWAKHNIDF